MLKNNYPALSGILSDLWCMEPTRLHRLVGDLHHANNQRFGGVIGDQLASPKMDKNPIVNGTINIPIHGVIMKRVPEIFSFLGIEATSTEDTGRAIKAALANDEVERIQLDIDSPGGTISGVQALSDVIHNGKTQKPIEALVSDLAASAAYWIGSQASSLEANRGALVGSIGVYRVLVDSSEAADKAGVKIHLISSGENKGTGTPGAPITEAQLRDEQRIVDGAATMFTEAIARGRPNLDAFKIQRLATGSTWFAQEAAELGLIDKVTAVEPQQSESVEDDGPTGDDAVENPTQENIVDGSNATEPEIEKLRLEVAQLTNELSAEKIQRQTEQVAMAAITETRKLEVIEQGVKAGRVVPAMRSQVEDFAAYCKEDIGKLRDFVNALPVQIRSEAQSEQPGTVSRETLSASDEAIAKLFRIDLDKFKANSEWSAISASGELLDERGNVIGGLN